MKPLLPKDIAAAAVLAAAAAFELFSDYRIEGLPGRPLTVLCCASYVASRVATSRERRVACVLVANVIGLGRVVLCLAHWQEASARQVGASLLTFGVSLALLYVALTEDDDDDDDDGGDDEDEVEEEPEAPFLTSRKLAHSLGGPLSSRPMRSSRA